MPLLKGLYIPKICLISCKDGAQGCDSDPDSIFEGIQASHQSVGGKLWRPLCLVSQLRFLC